MTEKTSVPIIDTASSQSVYFSHCLQFIAYQLVIYVYFIYPIISDYSSGTLITALQRIETSANRPKIKRCEKI